LRKTQRMLALAGLTLTASAGLALASTAAFAAPQPGPGPHNNTNQSQPGPNHQNGDTTTVNLPWLGNGGTTIVVNRDRHNGNWGDGRDNDWRQHGDDMRTAGVYNSAGSCERAGYWGEYRGYWDDFDCYRVGNHRYVLETINYGSHHHW
jgi:hypothetical protein